MIRIKHCRDGSVQIIGHDTDLRSIAEGLEMARAEPGSVFEAQILGSEGVTPLMIACLREGESAP